MHPARRAQNYTQKMQLGSHQCKVHDTRPAKSTIMQASRSCTRYTSATAPISQTQSKACGSVRDTCGHNASSHQAIPGSAMIGPNAQLSFSPPSWWQKGTDLCLHQARMPVVKWYNAPIVIGGSVESDAWWEHNASPELARTQMNSERHSTHLDCSGAWAKA